MAVRHWNHRIAGEKLPGTVAVEVAGDPFTDAVAPPGRRGIGLHCKHFALPGDYVLHIESKKMKDALSTTDGNHRLWSLEFIMFLILPSLRQWTPWLEDSEGGDVIVTPGQRHGRAPARLWTAVRRCARTRQVGRRAGVRQGGGVTLARGRQ